MRCHGGRPGCVLPATPLTTSSVRRSRLGSVASVLERPIRSRRPSGEFTRPRAPAPGFRRRATALRARRPDGRGPLPLELLLVYAQPPRPCPVRALRAWLDAAQITTGPIFRRVTRTGAISSPLTAQTVALIIKKRARAAGLDPREFAGHSLRSGYATQAALDGHHSTQIGATTRHQDQRVLAGYIRAGRGREDIAHVL
jgi:hypothetical protein